MKQQRPVAYGDLLSGILALVVIITIKGRWAMAIPLVWVFSIIGIVDLTNAFRQDDSISTMGATWFIPTFIVPVLLFSPQPPVLTQAEYQALYPFQGRYGKFGVRLDRNILSWHFSIAPEHIDR